MSKPWVIYALSDPRAPAEVRYVGKTVKKPEYRLTEHLAYSRKPVVTHLTCWLRSLSEIGLKPEILVLERGEAGADWISAEQRWIASFRAQGYKLCNATDGGEGGLGSKRSPESIAKVVAAITGRKASPESRLRMSEAKKGVGPVLTSEARARAVASRKASVAAGLVDLTPSQETVSKRAQASRATWERKRSAGWVKPDNWSTYVPDNMGRTHNEETKRKIGDANRGRVMSSESRKKMSESAKHRKK